jgi:hypothetical protein
MAVGLTPSNEGYIACLTKSKERWMLAVNTLPREYYIYLTERAQIKLNGCLKQHLRENAQSKMKQHKSHVVYETYLGSRMIYISSIKPIVRQNRDDVGYVQRASL